MTPNASTLPALDHKRVEQCIVERFGHGARCFNGEWWGGWVEYVEGSQYGFDIHVWKEENIFYAEAFGYKDEPYNIDKDNLLISRFALPFSFEISDKDDGTFTASIHLFEKNINDVFDGFESYLDASEWCVRRYVFFGKLSKDIKYD